MVKNYFMLYIVKYNISKIPNVQRIERMLQKFIGFCEIQNHIHTLYWLGKVFSIITQPVCNIETTLYGRCNVVKALKQRHNSVVLTSCAGWVLSISPALYNSNGFQFPTSYAR